MKVFIVSNGPYPLGDHRTKWAFDELVSRGVVQAFEMVSMGKEPGERKIFRDQVESLVVGFKPDLILWHRDAGTDLHPDLVQRVAQGRRLIYHDLDPWMALLKPITKNQQVLCEHASTVFLVGMGEIAVQFRAFKDKVRFSAHGYCDIDIPEPPAARTDRLVFIGSVYRKWGRILGPLAPEIHQGRTHAMSVLRRRLGARFVLHGNGYPANWGVGPCEFSEQFSLINESLASFAIDAAPHAPFYTSDRTPFCLACGSIHLKIRRPGDEVQFGDCPGFVSVRAPDQAADVFELVSSWSPSRKAAVQEETREFARKNLRTPDLYASILRRSMEMA